MTFLNVGCGTHRAPSPWVNTDTREADNTHPDVIVPAGQPFPFADGSCDRVLLSHILEHVPWPHLPSFLAEVRRVLDGEVLVVGPDVYRTLRRWREDQEPWHIVTSVLEHAAPPSNDNGCPEALHHWNCHEERVLDVLTRAGFTVAPVSIDPSGVEGHADWPIVGPTCWQFAVAGS